MGSVIVSKRINQIILHLDQGNNERKCAKIRVRARELD